MKSVVRTSLYCHELIAEETCLFTAYLVYIYIKHYYLSSYKLYMYMYTLRTAEIDVDTHEWVTEARIVKVRVGLKDKNKLINCQWRRNEWQYIKDLMTQKWNFALCPLMKTIKGMQLVLYCEAIHVRDECVFRAHLSCSFIWIYCII